MDGGAGQTEGVKEGAAEMDSGSSGGGRDPCIHTYTHPPQPLSIRVHMYIFIYVTLVEIKKEICVAIFYSSDNRRSRA